MPVFEGLLPEPHNKTVMWLMSLLFSLAEWHTLAKLWLHTATLLEWLDEMTHKLGTQLHYFKKYTCDMFSTHELPTETAAHGHWASQKQAKSTASSGSTSKATSQPIAPGTKTLNLITYKLHTLGDYVRTIKWFGTTDSYSTQPVCTNSYGILCFMMTMSAGIVGTWA